MKQCLPLRPCAGSPWQLSSPSLAGVRQLLEGRRHDDDDGRAAAEARPWEGALPGRRVGRRRLRRERPSAAAEWRHVAAGHERARQGCDSRPARRRRGNPAGCRRAVCTRPARRERALGRRHGAARKGRRPDADRAARSTARRTPRSPRASTWRSRTPAPPATAPQSPGRSASAEPQVPGVVARRRP